jgi:dephospho-CoA kinase
MATSNCTAATKLSENRSNRKKPIIGLTGGVGSGKSAIAQMLEGLGGRVIDFDRLAHVEICEPDILEKLLGWWGSSVVSPEGSVDRSVIANIVFHDPVQLQRLEDILYPRLMQRSAALLVAAEADLTVMAAVLDAPKLIEAGLDKLCDSVIFVDTPMVDRLSRVVVNRGWNEQELLRRENLQSPLDQKRANADYVIVNHAGLDELSKQVEQVFSSVLSSFKR